MNKKAIIFSTIGLAVVVGSGIFLWKFSSSPQYCLLQIKEALENRDYAEFEKYVDVDKTTSSLMDQLIQIMQNTSVPQDKGAMLSNLALGMGLFDAIKPQLTLLIKPQIQKWVEDGKFKTEGPLSDVGVYPLPAIWKKTEGFSSSGIEYVKTTGDVSTIGIGLRHTRFDTVLMVNIIMKNKGAYWQVTGIAGLSEFQGQVEKLEQRRVDAINNPIRKEFSENLKVTHFDKSPSESATHRKKVKLHLGLQNIGTKIISGYLLTLHLSDKNRGWNKEILINSETRDTPTGPFSAGRAVDLTLPEYGSGYEDEWLRDDALGEVKMAVRIESIRFSDGRNLQIHQKWE